MLRADKGCSVCVLCAHVCVCEYVCERKRNWLLCKKWEKRNRIRSRTHPYIHYTQIIYDYTHYFTCTVLFQVCVMYKYNSMPAHMLVHLPQTDQQTLANVSIQCCIQPSSHSTIHLHPSSPTSTLLSEMYTLNPQLITHTSLTDKSATITTGSHNKADVMPFQQGRILAKCHNVMC